MDIPIDITKQVSIGTSIRQRFAEELDLGKITIINSRREKEYDMFSLIEIIITTDNGKELRKFELFVMRDEVTPITKKANGLYYKHEIDLIELTSRLDQEFINTLSFTQPLDGRYLAPFKHRYQLIRENGNAFDVNVDDTYIYLPKVSIQNRYQTNIKIPLVEKSHSNYFVGSEKFTTTSDVYVKVYSLSYDGSQTYLPEHYHIISNSEKELDLEDGDYKITIGTLVETDFDEPLIDDYKYIREYQFFTRVSKNARITLYDIIDKIRITTPLEKRSLLNNTRLFSIHPKLEFLKNIYAPQLLLKRMTVRDGINTVLKYVNAVCRLVTTNINFSLDINKFNERRQPYNIDEIIDYSTDKDINNYNTKLRSYLSNLISSDTMEDPSVVQPSYEDFEGFRSETLQLEAGSPVVELKEPIYRMIKATAKIAVSHPHSNDFWGSVSTYEIDITPHVLEENEIKQRRQRLFLTGATSIPVISNNFDIMGYVGEIAYRDFLRDTPVEFAKYNYLGKKVDFRGGLDSAIKFPVETWKSMLFSALSEHLVFKIGLDSREAGVANHIYNGFGERSKLYSGRTIRNSELHDFYSPLFSEEAKLSNIKVKFEYITMGDLIHDAHKEDTENIQKSTTKIINQNGRIVAHDRVTANAYGVAQRFGVQTINYTKVSTSPTEIEEPGDYAENDEVVVEKETVLYNSYLRSNIEATKYFNRLSKYVGIDREYRPYEIPDPTRSEKREDIYNEYLEYRTSKHGAMSYKNDTYLRYEFMDNFLRTLTSQPSTEKPISTAIVYTDGMRERYPITTVANVRHEPYVIAPITKMGGKQTLSFKFGFKHNRSAGDVLDFQPSWWQGIISEPYGLWQEFIQYTDDDGRANEFHFEFYNKIPRMNYVTPMVNYNRTKDLPLTYKEYAIGTNTPTFGTPSSFVESRNHNGLEDPLVIKKDPSEQYNLTYQISIVPFEVNNHREVYIGTALTKYNKLITENAKETYLYIHNDGTKYLQFDEEKIKDGSVRYPISNYVEILYREDENQNTFPVGIRIFPPVQEYTSWAIGDEDENLYVAVNSDDDHLWFIPKNKRTRVLYNWFHYDFKLQVEQVISSVSMLHMFEIEDEISEFTNIESDINVSMKTMFSVSDAFSAYEYYSSQLTKGMKNSILIDDELLIHVDETTNVSTVLSVSMVIDDEIVIFSDEQKSISITTSKLFTVDDELAYPIYEDENVTKKINKVFVIDDEIFPKIYIEVNINHKNNKLFEIEHEMETLDWEYIGTSANEDSTFNAIDEIHINSTCRTSSQGLSLVRAQQPVSHYSEGHILRLRHYYQTEGMPLPDECTTYYYQVVKTNI